MGLSLGVPDVMVETCILLSTEECKSFRATGINFALQLSHIVLLEKGDNTSPKECCIFKK